MKDVLLWMECRKCGRFRFKVGNAVFDMGGNVQRRVSQRVVDPKQTQRFIRIGLLQTCMAMAFVFVGSSACVKLMALVGAK